MMETKITTAENLGMELYGCMNSAVLDYGDTRLRYGTIALREALQRFTSWSRLRKKPD